MFVPLLLAVARIAAGEWRRLAKEMVAAIGGALAALVIGSISYGSPRVWLQWIEAAGEFYGRLQTRSERNVAPALALFEQYGEWVSYVIAAILVAIVCVAIWRRRGGDPALLIGLGILIYLLGANVVWLHYMVLVIPIAVALMRWRATAVVALISLALIAEEPFEILTGKAAFPVEVMLITPAFVALFACGVWKLGTTPHPPSAPSPLAREKGHNEIHAAPSADDLRAASSTRCCCRPSSNVAAGASASRFPSSSAARSARPR
jgi:hypothetical protein